MALSGESRHLGLVFFQTARVQAPFRLRRLVVSFFILLLGWKCYEVLQNADSMGFESNLGFLWWKQVASMNFPWFCIKNSRLWICWKVPPKDYEPGQLGAKPRNFALARSKSKQGITSVHQSDPINFRFGKEPILIQFLQFTMEPFLRGLQWLIIDPWQLNSNSLHVVPRHRLGTYILVETWAQSRLSRYYNTCRWTLIVDSLPWDHWYLIGSHENRLSRG